MRFAGNPSDGVDAILATGRSGVSRLFMSMSARHPEGDDAGYLEWHTLDHRPEQHRLAKLRASLRLVSTPACREARAASAGEFDRVDHVMNYFFADEEGFAGFGELSVALREAGRTPFLLPVVERKVYVFGGAVADPQIKAGADVLPWRPARGVYLLVGGSGVSPAPLVEVAGVAGVWTGNSAGTADDSGIRAGAADQALTFCFLDDDPVAVATRLRPLLEGAWGRSGQPALLAAPFYAVVPFEWERYLP